MRSFESGKNIEKKRGVSNPANDEGAHHFIGH
jgi:hypothetical protein